MGKVERKPIALRDVRNLQLDETIWDAKQRFLGWPTERPFARG